MLYPSGAGAEKKAGNHGSKEDQHLEERAGKMSCSDSSPAALHNLLYVPGVGGCSQLKCSER